MRRLRKRTDEVLKLMFAYLIKIARPTVVDAKFFRTIIIIFNHENGRSKGTSLVG
jgi:putative AlgH/UPF0301 family transcriptional regulator